MPGKAAGEEAERLRRGQLRDFQVGLLHGQMHSNQKAEAMRAFAAGETDVLVATTVIEVGIDVPNATVMMIEGAERFGVSQLHQLRGRVGRGEHPSQCLLFATKRGRWRAAGCEAVEGNRDGFKLAEVDLELRGEGEILGTRQSGLQRFAVASLPEDGRAAGGPRRGSGPDAPSTARSRTRASARCSRPPAAASAPAPPTRSRSDRHAVVTRCGSSPES